MNVLNALLQFSGLLADSFCLGDARDRHDLHKVCHCNKNVMNER